MEEKEDFGYSFDLPSTKYHVAQSLQKEVYNSKKNIALSSFVYVGLPYVAERCYENFSEPWRSTIHGSMILLEIFTIGACLYSVYAWRQTSKRLSELEEKL